MTGYVPRHRITPSSSGVAARADATRGTPQHLAPKRRRRGGVVARLAIGLAIAALMATSAVVAQRILSNRSGAGAVTTDGPTAATLDAADIPVVEPPDRPEGPLAGGALPPASPRRVEIPSIGVSSELEPLGLNDDGTMQVPSDFQRAGWFTLGPQPGQRGPAIIAGHVDSEVGPAVFIRLGELAVGDEVLVPREDGTTARFHVTAIESYSKDAFPAAAVYGPVPGPELRLITCDGAFDASSRQYRDNLVVYAVGV